MVAGGDGGGITGCLVRILQVGGAAEMWIWRVASAGVDGSGGGLIGSVRWRRFGERELGRDLG